MREIKFRAYHKEAKEMLHGESRHVFEWEHEGQPLEIMQYTGLKDKNGVEIYEGDMVQTVTREGVKLSTFTIYWDNGMSRFRKLRDDNNNFDLDVVSEGMKEVIGNIHQNKDLLK